MPSIIQGKRGVMEFAENTLGSLASGTGLQAECIQHINECFLSLDADYDTNIRILTEATGQLLGATCVCYRHRGLAVPYTLTCWKDIEGILQVGPDEGPLCLDLIDHSSTDPVIVRNLQDHPGASSDPRVRDYQLQTYVEIPVIVRSRTVGSLCVTLVQDREPSTIELNLMHMMAHTIGQQEQIKQKARELRALNEISRLVTFPLKLDEILILLRNKVRDIVGAEICSIALTDPVTGELVFHQTDEPLATELVGKKLDAGQGIAGYVANTGQTLLVADVQTDPRFYNGIDTITGFSTREVLCAPLIAQEKTIGVIELLNKQHGQFTSDDVQFLESVAAQITSALKSARLHEATQRELNERVKAEKALRESTRQLQTFVEVAPELILLKDRDLHYLMVNQAFAKSWNISQSEIIGKTDFDFMPAEIAQECYESDLQVLQSRQTVLYEREQKDRIYETHKSPVIDDEGYVTGIAGIIRDITVRKRMEEQQIREQKHESILTLARGIAHDFNNALVGIVGNIDILRMDLAPTPKIEKTLDAMEQSARKMVTLTNQLVAYAGGGGHRPQIQNLNTLVVDALRITNETLPLNVTVDRDLAQDLWPVKVDPEQIRQVVISLLTNAYEAMDKTGGTLTLCTENTERPAWHCDLHHEHPAGKYIHLSIQDTGHGIDAEAQKRVFEPFFSTRFLGRGLGLAAALGTVRDHGGCIGIQSTPGQGTTVHLYLPQHKQLAEAQVTQQPELKHPHTVLVVEDEPIVRGLVQRALRRQGYTVILATDGEQALSIYEQLEAEIDLVLLDMGLPGIGGEAVLGSLRSRAPQIRVILTSGYTQDSVTKNIELGTKTWFLAKPFSIQALNSRIEFALADLDR